MNRVKSGPLSCFIKVLSASWVVWVVTFCILIRRTCIILFENVLFHHFLSTNDAASAQMWGSHWASHLGIRTNTSSLRRWAVLTNGLQVNWSCKVTVATSRQPSQWHWWLSDLASLIPCEPFNSTNTSHFFSNTSVKKKEKKRNHWCPLIQTVIMRYTISIDFVMSLSMSQVIQCRTQFAGSFHVDQTVSLFLLECLSNSTFFNPLLKECHSCSASTEPWVCLRAYPSPSAHTIALFSLAHTLSACTVQAKKHGNIQCRCAGACEAICCTIWPSILIGILHVQSSDVQKKHRVRKAS